MKIFNFFAHKKDDTGKGTTQFMTSYASVEGIDRIIAKLHVETVDFSESDSSNFDHIPTFEGFVLTEELPLDTKEGDLLAVRHDGKEVFEVIEKCDDEGDARRQVISARVSNVLAHAQRE